MIQIQTIGDLIHKYRREAGLTLSQLSDMTGAHKGTISRIENGDVKRPEFQTVHPLASALGIPFEDIVERYIEIDKRADSLQTILQAVIQSGNTELINKVALKFLESPSEDSYSLVERLYALPMLSKINQSDYRCTGCSFITPAITESCHFLQRGYSKHI